MDYIFEDMYHAILYRKAPPYAPLVMRLINTQPHGSPLAMPPNLTEHTLVSLQQKGDMRAPPRRSHAHVEEEISETERAPSPTRA